MMRERVLQDPGISFLSIKEYLDRFWSKDPLGPSRGSGRQRAYSFNEQLRHEPRANREKNFDERGVQSTKEHEQLGTNKQ